MCDFRLSNDCYITWLNKRIIKIKLLYLGSAYYTGACAYNLTDPWMESVGLLHDTGAFAGIIPTAHEVGHL